MSSTAGAAAPHCVLGFDVGARRIGVALANTLSASARALATVERNAEAWSRLDALLADWRPQLLVVGDPLTLDGDLQEATHLARRFARQLGERYKLPVVLVDERASSKEADRRFAAARAAGTARRRDGASQDARAAQIILERWFESGMPTHPSPVNPTDEPV
jgi:putative holliday junction resolvase